MDGRTKRLREAQAEALAGAQKAATVCSLLSETWGDGIRFLKLQPSTARPIALEEVQLNWRATQEAALRTERYFRGAFCGPTRRSRLFLCWSYGRNPRSMPYFASYGPGECSG